MRRSLYWLSIIGSIAGAAYFLLWAVQTAWLSSIPGYDVHAYRLRFYWQLGGAAAWLLLALFVAIRYRRRDAPQKTYQ